MNFFDMFRSERRKWARAASGVEQKWQPALPKFNRKTFELYDKALPRGILVPRLQPDRERINYWMSFHELRRHSYRPGQIILGKVDEDFIGELDDRPMVTIAGSRAGKTSTILTPNLYLYPGSMLVLDPKGELARNTAAFRRQMGQTVHVLDPFGQSGEKAACFNFLDALDENDPAVIDNIAQITAALVPTDGDTKNRHFTDNARALLQGLILLTLTMRKEERNLVTVSFYV